MTKALSDTELNEAVEAGRATVTDTWGGKIVTIHDSKDPKSADLLAALQAVE